VTVKRTPLCDSFKKELHSVQFMGHTAKIFVECFMRHMMKNQKKEASLCACQATYNEVLDNAVTKMIRRGAFVMCRARGT
jgi:hypothetical protein